MAGAYPIGEGRPPERAVVGRDCRTQSRDVPETRALHSFSQELADLVAETRRGLVLPHPTRVPVTGAVWSDDRVLTVAHAMGARDEGRVLLPDGSEAKARIMGRDPALDLALLEVEGARTGALAWADTANLRPGELVLAVGLAGTVTRNETGEPTVRVSPSMSLGPVAYVGGPWRSRAGGKVDALLEVDATLHPGASGGVLVTTDGRLVGLNTHALRHGGATLPVETLRAAVTRLEQGVTTKPGWLGVGLQPARVQQGASDDGEGERQLAGVLINAVRKESPAERGGLLVGDVLLSIDGEPVPSYRALRAILLGRGGQTVHVVLFRGGQRVELDLEVGERAVEAGEGMGWGRRRGGRSRRSGPLAN